MWSKGYNTRAGTIVAMASVCNVRTTDVEREGRALG